MKKYIMAELCVMLFTLGFSKAFMPVRPSCVRMVQTSIDMATGGNYHSSFSEGLKLILVPQAKNRIVPGSFYDSERIPDLEAPSTINVAKAMSSPIARADNHMTSAKHAVEATVNAATDQSQAMKDAEAAVSAAKELVASLQTPDPSPMAMLEMPSGLNIPDVPHTLANTDFATSHWQDRVSHPLSLDDLQHLSVNLNGDGLAVSTINSIMKMLHEMRDDPAFSPSKIVEAFGMKEPSQEFQTVAYGFEVKTSALEASSKLRAKTIETGHWFADEMKDSIDRSESTRQAIKDTLLAQSEFARTKSAEGLEAAGVYNDNFKKALLTQMDYVATTTSGNLEAARPYVKDAGASIIANADRIKASAGSIELPQSMELPMAKFATIGDALQQAIQTPDLQVADILETLDVHRLGGYSAGVVVGLLLVATIQQQQQRTVKRDVSEGAVVLDKAKKLQLASKEKSSSTAKDDVEKDKLESMVIELTKAVGILMDELKELKEQKAETDQALATLKSDTGVAKTNKKAEAKIMAKMKTTNEKYDVVQSKLDAAQLEVETLQEANGSVASLLGELFLSSLSLAVSQSRTNIRMAKDVLSGPGTEKVPQPPKAKPEPTPTKEDSNFFFSAGAGKENVAKAEEEKNFADLATSIKEDWSNLPLAAIKKKPATELMDYLNAKGVSPVNEEGKPLKKDELVQAVAAFGS